MIGTIIQVFIAITIVIIMFVIAFSVYNKEFMKSIQDFGKIRTETTIFEGIKDFHISKDEKYDTVNVNSPLYLNLPQSYNQSGGGEYSYNFWLYLDPSPTNDDSTRCKAFDIPTSDKTHYTDRGIEAIVTGDTVDPKERPIILFLKGNKTPYQYLTTLCESNINSTNQNRVKTDILVKSPLVKLERGCDVMTVEFNTYKSPDSVKIGARDTCTELKTQWEFMNAYKIGVKNLTSKDNFRKKWFMVTITLQDTLPTDPSAVRNKIRCVIYINGTVELDRYIDGQLENNSKNIETSGSIIKQNSGNFYINPAVSAKKVIIPNNDGKTLKTPIDIDYTKPGEKVDIAKSVMMADLHYFNYCLTPDDVASLFNRGITKKYAPVYSDDQQATDENAFMNNLAYATSKKSLLELNTA